MSQENVELVRRLLEMFARREHEAVFAFYDTDIQWDATNLEDAISGLSGIYHGHDGVRTYWRRWLQAWADLEFEVHDVLDAGGEVVALIHEQRQWGRHSGIATDIPPYGLVFTIRNGKVVRWRVFSDERSALEAVGLRERAMSQENVEIVREAFSAYMDRGLDAMAEFLDPEISWRAAEGALDDVGEMHGHEAVRRYLEDWIDMFDDVTIVPEEVLDLGDDRVLAVQHATGRAKASGVQTDIRYAVVYTLRDGKIVRAREYLDRAKAFEAVGLRE